MTEDEAASEALSKKPAVGSEQELALVVMPPVSSRGAEGEDGEGKDDEVRLATAATAAVTAPTARKRLTQQ